MSGGTCPYLRSHGRSELCRAGTLRPETHITQQQPQHGICPHAQREKTTHFSRKPASKPPLCFFCSRLPWGKAGQVKNSSGVTILTPEAEERLDEPELELEQPELGRSAGLRFADPEEAPTSPGPPARQEDQACP